MTTLQTPTTITPSGQKSPVSEQNDLEQTFTLLVEDWQRDTMMLSSVNRMAMHPAYQRIIGMGAPALPMILQELQDRPNHWFWALNAITGEDPAQPEDNFDTAREAWLQWGRQRGYIK